MENRYYVYCLINKDWEVPFYIGKGTGDRYKSPQHRSSQVQAIMKKYTTEPKILISDLSEADALVLEKWLKVAYKECGYPIIDSEKEGRATAQRAGIKQARIKGKRFGRPTIAYPDNWRDVYTRWKKNQLTGLSAMEELGLSRSTFYRLVNKYEQKKEPETA